MALMTDDTFVRLVQRRLAESGHYTGAIDGMAGDGTKAALDLALPPLVIISGGDDEFRLETRNQIGGDWTAAETPFPTLDAAKEAA